MFLRIQTEFLDFKTRRSIRNEKEENQINEIWCFLKMDKTKRLLLGSMSSTGLSVGVVVLQKLNHRLSPTFPRKY